jgi:SAM-dependent methyltransferase
MNGNMPIFSPDLAQNSHGYNVSFFALFAPQEAVHFWFRVRNSLIIWALGKYGARVASFMEIGCGTGFVLQGIASCFPQISLVGSEICPEGMAFAAERIKGRGEIMQMDARHIPFVAEFDAVGAFDVIEHIEEDDVVLQQIYRALKSDGLLLLTVPQHRWLWTATDANACHVKRYSMRELHNKVTLAGFTIVRSTSFVSSLLPFMLISRLFKREKTENAELLTEFRINPILNRIFEAFLRLELWLIRRGVSFPVGSSRLIVAAKTDKN